MEVQLLTQPRLGSSEARVSYSIDTADTSVYGVSRKIRDLRPSHANVPLR